VFSDSVYVHITYNTVLTTIFDAKNANSYKHQTKIRIKLTLNKYQYRTQLILMLNQYLNTLRKCSILFCFRSTFFMSINTKLVLKFIEVFFFKKVFNQHSTKFYQNQLLFLVLNSTLKTTQTAV
jgi:hypothetical protein